MPRSARDCTEPQPSCPGRLAHRYSPASEWLITQPAAVSVSAYRPDLDAAEEERLGKLVIAAASRISDRLGGLGNMVSW